MGEIWPHLFYFKPHQGKSSRKTKRNKTKKTDYLIRSDLCLGQCFSIEFERERKNYISVSDNGKRTNSQTSAPLSETQSHRTNTWLLLTKPGVLLHPGTEHRLHWGGGCAKGLSYLGVPNMKEQNQAHSAHKSHSQKLEECRANPAPARKVKCMTQLSLLCSQAHQDSGFQREFFLQKTFPVKRGSAVLFHPKSLSISSL